MREGTRVGCASEPEFTRTLDRGLAVIRAFGGTADGSTLSELSARTGVTRAAVRRAVRTLEADGFVERVDARRFRLLPATLTLGFRTSSALGWRDIAGAHLAALAGEISCTCSLATRHGDETETRVVVLGPGLLAVDVRLGSRHAISDTAAGALLADHRDRRWRTVTGALDDELRTIAVPVRDRTAAVRAALCAWCPRRIIGSFAAARGLVPVMERAARAVEHDVHLLDSLAADLG